ncbi:cobalamin B12-binding domain-containing protein [Tissierella creatinini]|nr:cobalamin B12-binding domain-containing protein [Tissierella creatinini]TJX64162.1 cobalamin B12-binding domain-containing protein [Soehngenia saccharolytica]
MDYKEALLKSLDKEDKDKSVQLAIKGLNEVQFTIPFLYEEILRPFLYSIDECKDDDCIWKEHVRTSIVRTIIECVYPHVIEQKKEVVSNGLKVLLVCPEKEYHEIGLRMVADFFSLNGYEAIFIGTNTPKKQVLYALVNTEPDYLAISVTDYYLLFEAKKMIEKIKSISGSIKIIVGGRAFKNNKELIKEMEVDIYLETYEDIVNLRKGDTNEISL